MNFEQPPIEDNDKPESKPPLSPEEIKTLLQAHSDEYDRQAKAFHEAIVQFDLALEKYGREDYRTQDRKKRWDDVDRAKTKVAKQIEQDMLEFPDYKDIFKI